MATAEPANDLSQQGRGRRLIHYFFPGMAAFAVMIAVTGFAPEVLRFAAGTFPIPWVLHIHAAIMVSWLGAFALQAWLGATGRTDQHRRVGRYAVAAGWLACASMVFVEFRSYIAHPSWNTRDDLDWRLPGWFIILTFGAFLAWAVHERRRPHWHKRLMTLAVFLSLEAAVQRVTFIPRGHPGMFLDLPDAAVQRFAYIPRGFDFWPIAATLDLFMLAPIAVYDLRTLSGRLHPATIRGALALLSAEAVFFALWGSPAWRTFALALGDWTRTIWR